MQRFKPVPLVVVVLAAVCAWLLPSCGGGGGASYEKEWLEQVEDLSEALANDLLALSVDLRERDLEAIANYFDDEVECAPLPVEPAGFEPVVKWIRHHGWRTPDGAARPTPRDEVVGRVESLLGHFSEIEDARIKVKGAEFDPAHPDRASARLKAFVIGRDAEGRREGLTLWLQAQVVHPEDGPWRLRGFEVESIDSRVADVDLFSEIALPAGVAAMFPPFGVGANTGFVAHGAATADVNGDGLLDIAATGVERNFLYLNRGDGGFDDASESSLVGLVPPGAGALFFDHDHDGDPDLFFAALGNQILLENRFVPDGEVKFWDVSEDAGVAHDAVGFSAVAADVDGNGFTDVYVSSYNRYGTVMPNAWDRATNGTPNLLFLNQGDGTFQEAAESWGVRDPRWSYAAAFADVDEDGDPDLYVANDFGENAFYRNDGERFVDVAAEAGIVDPGFGMGVSFGDYDNDGDLDLHVTNMSSTAGMRILKRLYPKDSERFGTLSKLAAGNNLYENEGDGTFRDVTKEVGGFSGGWAFGGGFFDFDNDGWEDVYTPNGFISGKSMKDT